MLEAEANFYSAANLTVAVFFFFKINAAFYKHVWLTADLGGSGGALALLEEEKRLGPPAVNKVDLPTDGLNDREAD